MKNYLILLSYFLLNISCSNINSNKSTLETKKEATQLNNETTTKLKESTCRCFDGIGSSDKDKPIKTHTFKNNISVSICGYHDPKEQNDKLIISEFDIFNCKTGKSYVRFGALENCMIETSNDTIIIKLMDYLPNNEKWEWNSVIKAQQTITVSEDSLKVSPLLTCYKKTGYNKAVVEKYLNSFLKEKGANEEWEDTIGRLKFLSLEGNQKAWDILKAYDKHIGYTPDGAMAEDWKDAIATVQWMIDFK